MSDVSANLNDLDTFVTRADAIATQLGESMAREKATFHEFAFGAGSGVGPDATGLMTRAEGLRDEITELGTFVRLVHDALQLADSEPVDGTVTVSSAEMEDLMREAAANAGVDYEAATAVDDVVEATVPAVGTVPADSGWVGDPVLTATGHFVIDEIDLPMPDRLAVLRWNRTYASIDDTDVGLGRGWFSWLNAELTSTDAAVTVTDQFGRRSVLAVDPSGVSGSDEFVSGDGSVRCHRDDDAYVVRWGRRSAHAYETWRFGADDGQLTTVAAETLGVTHFERSGNRLVALHHDSGRRLDVRWDGDRLAGLTSSDGRTADFDVTDGHLCAVSSPGCSQRYHHDDAGRIDAVIDADDVTLVELSYDERGRAIEQRENTGGGARFEYEERRTFVSDLGGVRRAGYLHDEQGRVIVASGDPLEPLTRRFDGAGRTVHQTNSDGSRWSMTVEHVDVTDADDVHDRAIVLRESIVHTGDDVEVFDYDALERIRSYSHNDHQMRYSYDGESVLPARVDAAGGWFVELTWDRGHLVRVVDADGVASAFEHDRFGNIVAAVDGIGNRTEYRRHAGGQATEIRFADGSACSARFDDRGRLLALADEEGGEIVFEMTPAGRLVAVTDPTGSRVELRYDAAGLPIEMVDAAGHSLGVEVDGEHRPATLTLPDGSTREIERDAAGRVTGVCVTDVSPVGDRTRTWSIARDARRSAVTFASPGGRVTAFTTQVGAVRHEIVQAGGVEASLVVDEVGGGRETVFTDPTGAVWTSSTDVAARAVSRFAPDGSASTAEYTPAGRVHTVSEAGRTVTFDYDGAGRISARDEGYGPWMFGRDARGRITSIESPQGRRRTYTYDRVGRVSASAVGATVTRQDYDASGRLVRRTYPDGAAATFEWGARGELLTSTDRAGGLFRYEYDERRRMVAMTDAVGGRTVVEYAFDHLPAAVTDPAGNRREFVYDDDGVLLAERDADRELRYDLDALGRRRAVELRSAEGSELRHRLSYERDAAGAVLAVLHDGEPLAVEVVAPTAASHDFAEVRLTYDLDGLGYRTETDGFDRTVHRDEAGRRMEIVDVFDDVAHVRRVERDASGGIGAVETDASRTEYGFHRSGFLASSSGPDASTTWDYDAAGRLVVENGPRGRREFRYDAAHRLVELAGVTGTTWFGYDPGGRRISATGAVERTYEWDLTGLRACTTPDGLVEFERDAFGRVTHVATPRGVTEIVWRATAGFATPLAIGDVEVISDGASVAALRSGDGTIRPVAELAGPWGELDGTDEFEVTWHPFHGLTVAGLVVLGERVYDIATRQFLSPDRQQTIVGMASSGWTYCYAANDPVNLLDPLGLAPLSNEEFERIQDRYTSVQWGNIAKVAIVVAAVVLTPAGAGPLLLAGIGAAAAGGGELAKQVINNEFDIGQQGYQPGAIVKEAVFGAIGGGGAGWLQQGSRFAPFFEDAMTTVGGRAAVNFGSGVVETTAVETWDAAGLWGSDGSFDPEEILWGGVGSVVGGEINHQLTSPRTTSATTGTATDNPASGADLPAPTSSPAPATTTAPAATADISVPQLAAPVPSTGTSIVPYDPPTTALVPWEAPVTDLVPVLPPIRVNTETGIYHVPGGVHYDRLSNPNVVEVDNAFEAAAMGARPSRN